MMEQVQQKRGLRIAAAIMFLISGALEVISYTRYFVVNFDWIFDGDRVFLSVLSDLTTCLIYVAMYLAVAAGLLAKKKNAPLRIAFGAVFASLLFLRIIGSIGNSGFADAFRYGWNWFLMLAAAAAVLFAFKGISVAGVGFAMFAWNSLNIFIYTARGAEYEWYTYLSETAILIAFALAAVVCFLNDNTKRPKRAAKPLGIVAMILIGVWYLTESSVFVYQNIEYDYDAFTMVINPIWDLLLFCGIVFAMIAIAFRREQKAVPVLTWQQPQPVQQQRQQPVQQWQQPIPQQQWQQPVQQWQQPVQQWQQPVQQWQQPVQQYAQPQWQEELAEERTIRAAEEEFWTCPVCGAKIRMSARFCQNCGTQRP